jgi:type VI secretion system protein ImpA
MSEETTEDEIRDESISDSEGDAEMAENESPHDAPSGEPDTTAEESPPSSATAFDASALPPIEAEYQDEELNSYIRAALTPISAEFPCGANEDAASSVISQIETTGDAIHESLRTAFGEAVRDDNLGTFDLASSGRDASELVEQIVECLEQKCKSLVLASYLPHLLLICNGFPGFGAGLDIFRELVLRYSDLLYPQDKEKIASFLRRGVYVGNDDKVTDNYKLFLYCPITERNHLPYALLRNSRLKSSNGDIDSKYANDAAGSTPQFFVKLLADLNSAIESAKQANAAIGGYLGDPLYEIVNFSFIESLERMASIIENLATENCGGYPPAEQEAVAEGAIVAAAGAPVAATAGEIVNREQAIELLRRVADFFHRTERHSPVSYRIRETIRWCNMELPELLKELLSGDEGPLEELAKRVGYRNLSDSDDED